MGVTTKPICNNRDKYTVACGVTDNLNSSILSFSILFYPVNYRENSESNSLIIASFSRETLPTWYYLCEIINKVKGNYSGQGVDFLLQMCVERKIPSITA